MADGVVADQLMELAGGDPFAEVRRLSEEHPRVHGCGLHRAGGPQMQLVAAVARAANAERALDLGRTGDLVVLCVDHASLAWNEVQRRLHGAPEAGAPGDPETDGAGLAADIEAEDFF